METRFTQLRALSNGVTDTALHREICNLDDQDTSPSIAN